MMHESLKWKRYHDQRIIEKRLRISDAWGWPADSTDRPDGMNWWRWMGPNRLRKYNLNCTCRMCKRSRERYERERFDPLRLDPAWDDLEKR